MDGSMTLSLPAKTPLLNFRQHPSIDVKLFAGIAVLQQAIFLESDANFLDFRQSSM